MRNSTPLFLLLLASALLVLPAGADELAAVGPLFCSSEAPAPDSLEGGTLLGEVEQRPENKIQNGPCSWCNQNSGCSTACIDDNDNQSSCGDYGVCDACREGLVEIDRQLVAQKAKTVFWGVCEFKWYYDVTYQSQNLSTCQPYHFCETDTENHTFNPYDLWCCDEIPGGCFGSPC
jgi:hypothetical protein